MAVLTAVLAAPKASEYNTLVPELCRFFGIIIRMFVEVQASHHTPHFHAYYQEHVAVYGIEPVELLAGALPKRQPTKPYPLLP